MKKRGIIKWILLSIISIWIIISTFFYFQHRIQVDTYYIGKYIEFDEFSVFVKNVEKYNFENNRHKYPDALFKLNLPWKITKAISKINYFYSKPYSFNKESYKYNVNCEIIFNPDSINKEYKLDNINKMMSIEVYNEALASVGKLSESRMQYESNSNVMIYTKIGNWNENFSNGLKVSDTKNGNQYLIPFEKSFFTKNYGYFNSKNDDRQQMTNDIILKFLCTYHNGDIKAAENYINDKYVDDFPWNTVNQYKEFVNANFELSYIGNYKGEEDVFHMNTSFYQEDNLKNNLNFYLIYRDFNWQIIYVE